MSPLMWAFFLVLACATAYQNGKLESRQGKRQLVYRYEVQLSTGSEASSQLWSGLRLTADLILQINNKDVVAQMKNVSIQKMDKFLSEDTPNFFVQGQSHLLDGIEVEIREKMVEPLQKPFSFTWNQGHVDTVVFEQQHPMYVKPQPMYGKHNQFEHPEPLFSINIKKGILNLLHLNMDKLFSMQVNKDKSFEMNGQQESYTAMDPSPFGHCLTRYTPELVPDNPLKDIFYLVKVRNYSSCYQRPPMAYSFDNLNTENNQSMEHLNLQNEVKYGIQGNRHSFIIDSAIGQGKIIFVPYARQDGTVQTSINQTLYLIQESPLRQSLPTIQGHRHRAPEALTMRMPVDNVQDRRPYVFQDINPNPQSPWSIMKMHQLLNLVANGTSMYPSQQLLPLTQTLMEMVRQSTKGKLKSLLFYVRSDQAIIQQEPGQPLRQQPNPQQQWQQQQAVQRIKPLQMKVLWNLLSNAGATQASEVVLEECLHIQEEQHIPSFNSCIPAVTAIGLYSPPSEKIILQLLELIERNKVTDNERAQAASMEEQQSGREQRNKINFKSSLVQTSILALGSILGRGEQIANSIEKFVQRRLREIDMVEEQFTAQDSNSKLLSQKQELISKSDKISNAHLQIYQKISKDILDRLETVDKVLMLKFLRNAHSRYSLPRIEKILLPKEGGSKTVVRIAAAQALETFTHPKRPIWKVLEKVVKDPTDTMSVRVQAFRSMVNLHAPVYMLVRLADSISYEKDKQLSTYVWSVFNIMANSTFRPYRRSADMFRQAMATMKPVQYGIEDSQYHSMQMDLANEVTLLKESSYVAGPDFSHNLDLSSTLDIFGTTNKAFQVTIVSEGLLRVARSMLGEKGFLTNRNSLLDLLERPKRDSSGSKIHHKIEEIFRRLRIKERIPPETEAYADLQVMNQVIRVHKLSTFLQNLEKHEPFVVMDVNENRIRAGVPLHFETSGIINQYHMELPTEVGFPVHLQMGVSYTAKLNGTASVLVQPNIYKDLRNGMPPRIVEFQIDAQPKIVGALTGKMSVDGFLLQTGNLFEAMLSLQSGGQASISFDLFKNRLTASVAPTCSSRVPLLKMEMKPYVYSLAVAPAVQISPMSLDSSAEPTNNRPVFVTMQPVAISQGAQLKQGQYTLGRSDQGYRMTLQGQYPVKALPYATTSPLLGRSHYSVYVDSGMENPPPLTADIRYFSHRRYQKEACDSWFPWQCYSTDSDSPAPILSEPRNASYEFGKVRDIPDLNSDITLHALKENILATVGQKMSQKTSKTEWGLIAIFNGTRSTVVKVLSQSWNKGQYHQSILTLRSIPLYDPKAEVYKLAIKNSAIYPGQKFSVENLLSTAYQLRNQKKMYAMLQKREHRVVNMYMQRLLMTLINQDQVRQMPSMDPQIMLDRIMPENVLVSRNPYVAQARQILKTLLPISQQLTEVRSEMHNAFQIELQHQLLRELQEEIIVHEDKIKRLIERIGKEQNIPRADIAAAQYTVLKLTQAVLDITEVVERGLNVNLLVNPGQFKQRQMEMQEKLEDIFRLSLANFGSKEKAQSSGESRNLDDNDFENTIGYDQLDSSSASNERQPISQQDIIPNLKALTMNQLQQIRDLYQSIRRQQMPTHQSIIGLIESTTSNVTMLNKAMKQISMINNRTMTTLITQATIQHQLLVNLLRVSRINSDNPNTIDNFDRYSIKVQTKELLERGYIIDHQNKAALICSPNLNLTERQQLRTLQRMDRQLLAVQRDSINQPSNQNPWTASTDSLWSALSILQPVLNKLWSIRNQLVTMDSQTVMPHPCLVSKLVDTATTLRYKVAILQRTLLAQPQDQMELSRQYQKMDDESLDFVVSLSPVFNIYVNVNASGQKPIFPRGEILISQSLMEVLKIGRQQHDVLHRMLQYLDQPFPLPYDEVKMILKDTADDAEALLNELKESSRRLSSSMRTTCPLTARAVYQQFVMALNKQLHVYDQIQGYLQKYPSLRSELNIEVNSDKLDTKKLLLQLQKLTLPGQVPNSRVKDQSGSSSNSSPASDSEDVSLEQLSQDSYELHTSSESQPQQYLQDLDQVADMDMVQQQQASSAMRDDVAEIQSPQVSEQILKKRPLDLAPLFEGIIMNTNITYGHSNYLGIQLYAQKSVGQLLWETSQFYPKDRDYAVSRTVEEAIMGRHMMEKNCQGTCLRLNAYNHIHMHASADSDQLQSLLKQGMQAMMLRNLAHHNDRTDIMKAQPFIQPGTMQAILELSHMADSLDEYLMSEKQTMAVQSVPMDPYLTIINPFQNDASMSRMLQKHFSNGLMPAECQVENGNLKTVDGAIFTLPAVQKPMLLAADCSPQKTFALLMQAEPLPQADQLVRYMDPRNRQKLEILAQDHEVTLKPRSLSVEVAVDGQVIPLRPGQPYVVYKRLKSGTMQVALVIALEEKGAIQVDYPMVGLNLKFKVNGFNLELSSIYSKQLCGLCGNFDGQITWELEGPQERIFTAKDNFASSYNLGKRPRHGGNRNQDLNPHRQQ